MARSKSCLCLIGERFRSCAPPVDGAGEVDEGDRIRVADDGVVLDLEDDSATVLLIFTLQVDVRKPSDIVDPGHPILPFEDVNWVFGHVEKVGKVRRHRLNAPKDTRRWAGSRYDVDNLCIEQIACA
jgi:hypothetical protein